MNKTIDINKHVNYNLLVLRFVFSFDVFFVVLVAEVDGLLLSGMLLLRLDCCNDEAELHAPDSVNKYKKKPT